MKEKNNYFLGILGALIGGLIFTIPWILVYVYGNMILSLLALVVAFGAYKFYKLFKGKVTKRTPLIIGIVSILCISLATLVIIPVLLVYQKGFGFHMEILEMLYKNSEFMGALLQEYIVSVLFTVLGISGIIRTIQSEAYDTGHKVDAKDILEYSYDEQINKLEEIYSAYNAFDRNRMVPTTLILNELPPQRGKNFFNQMKKSGIIVVKFGKTYFDKEAVNNKDAARINRKTSQTNSFLVGLLLTVALIGSIAVCVILTTNDNSSKTEEKMDNLKTFNYKDITIKLPDTFKEEKADGYKYYRNYGYGLVTDVVLEEYELTDTIQNEYEYFKGDYLKELEYTLISQEDYKKDNLLGHKLVLKSQEYPNEYCVIYGMFGSYTYLISYYTVLDNATDQDIQNFVNKTEEYQKNVTINKDSAKI